MTQKTLFAFLFSVLVAAGSASAAPKAELWDYWTASDPGSTLRIDHGPWDSFLKTYIFTGEDGVNRVKYAEVSDADKATLDAHIKNLENIEVRKLNKSEQMAFWINLYNALTVKIILDHYPVDSIVDIDISPGFFSNGPWGRKLLSVEGKEISLDDIEHRILRPVWKDPRVHYAVNCASIGCPNLQNEAFTAANADRLLNKGAAEYVNHPRGAEVHYGKLVVSSIYEWFKADFGGDDAGVIEHLKKYAKPPLQGQLEQVSKISDDHYDWSLNVAP